MKLASSEHARRFLAVHNLSLTLTAAIEFSSNRSYLGSKLQWFLPNFKYSSRPHDRYGRAVSTYIGLRHIRIISYNDFVRQSRFTCKFKSKSSLITLYINREPHGSDYHIGSDFDGGDGKVDDGGDSGGMIVRISDDSTAQLESLSFSVIVLEGVYNFLKTHT